MPINTFGDISPRTSAYVVAELLERQIPHLVFEKFGQAKTLPARSTKTMTWRRYSSLDSTPNYLTEGVTPSGKEMSYTDVSVTLSQMGDGVKISDIVIDTHEDPIIQENQDILSEQSAEMVEKMRYGVLKAGTNVCYAGGVANRASVVAPISISDQRRVIKTLKAQNARKITNVVRSTASYGTVNVAPSYVAVIHSDCQADVEALPGFKAAEEYGSISPYENEIGKVGEVRYLTTTLATAFADSGGAASTNSTVSTTGTSADVYPMLFFGKNAYGIVALKGKFAITPMVVNPQPSDSDPWAQRGWITWKTMQGCVILQDLYMCRLEVACTDW